MFKVEKTNSLEKTRFLEFKHHSILEKNNALTQEIKSNKFFSSVNEVFHPGTKVLNEILDKCKTNGNKQGLRYMNKNETPFSGETVFVKGKNVTLNQVESLKKHHYAHTKRKLVTLNLDVTLGSKKV